jgi:hypothetical protein
MSDEFQTARFDPPPAEISLPYRPLPPWLARRLLRPEEQVTWVRGPRWNPWWERYATHPVLFLAALAIGAACVAVARLRAGSWSDMHPAPAVVAVALFFGSIYVLAIANAYFTRLVVTDRRIVILQGHEVCRTWRLDRLPRSLIRYGKKADGTVSRSVDLDTLQTMLGGASDQFAEAKTIRSLGKQLDQITAREIVPPRE